MNGSLSRQELLTMRKAGRVASAVLKKLNGFIRPGILTKNIEEFFESEIIKYPGMEAAFKGYRGYPASCCVSVNEEIIHGIPSQRVVNDGDIVSVDLGIRYKGLFVDAAYTYIIGKASLLARRLVKVTRQSLRQGIMRIKPGRRVGDLSSAIQKGVEKNGFSVIRRFVGHGIGRSLHLPPEVPNFGEAGKGAELFEGCVIAVEPMVSVGSSEVDILSDGWTAKTKDNSLTAHFEHTIAVTKNGSWVLTQ
ncbi:MAG: type I methionyl aminopeptidase [Candidatus Omnitrophota bacterium]